MMQDKYYENRSEFERDLDRFAAFSRVFTRNYLYRIELLMSEIQAITLPRSSALTNKISSLFDILQMALAYYARSVKSFPAHIALDKTVRLLHFVRSTVRICVEHNFFDDDDFIIQVYSQIFSKCLLFNWPKLSTVFLFLLSHKTLVRKIDDTCTQLKVLRESRASKQIHLEAKLSKNHTLAMYRPAAHAARKSKVSIVKRFAH